MMEKSKSHFVERFAITGNGREARVGWLPRDARAALLNARPHRGNAHNTTKTAFSVTLGLSLVIGLGVAHGEQEQPAPTGETEQTAHDRESEPPSTGSAEVTIIQNHQQQVAVSSPGTEQNTTTLAASDRRGATIGVAGVVAMGGDLKVDVPGFGTTSVETNGGFGLRGEVSYAFSDFVDVSLSPEYLFGLGVAAGDFGDESDFDQLNIPIRVVVGNDVSAKLRIYGYGAIGYSILFDNTELADNPKGLMFDLGGGGAFQVGENLFLAVELGYNLGRQSTEVEGVDVDVAHDYLHISAGILTRM